METVANIMLVLIAVLIAHLVEEVVTGFRTRLPVGEMPRPIFVGLNVVIYAYCFSTLALAVQGRPLALPLAWVLALAMSLNGLAHAGMMIARRRYFPGGFTALPLLLASALLMAALVGV
jgi:hypothetical protein